MSKHSPEKSESSKEDERKSLHAAHAEQTLGRMLHLGSGLLASFNVFACSRDEVLLGLRTYLNALVRRIDAGAAAHLIAQLPSQLADELRAQPSGPDVSIDRAVVERLLRQALKLRADQVADAFDAFTELVVLSVARGETNAVKAQLPAAMRQAFDKALAAVKAA